MFVYADASGGGVCGGRGDRATPSSLQTLLRRAASSAACASTVRSRSVRRAHQLEPPNQPPVLRSLSLAPREIEAPRHVADALYPPIGRPKSAIRVAPDAVEVHGPLDRPPALEPLGPHGALHPAYRLAAEQEPPESADAPGLLEVIRLHVDDAARVVVPGVVDGERERVAGAIEELALACEGIELESSRG